MSKFNDELLSAEQLEKEISNIRVLDQYVLVKQKMVKKKSAIIMDAARDQKHQFDYSFEVVAKGQKCEREGIDIGDFPVFEEHVQFMGLKVIEKTDNGMTSLVLVHENSIIAIDLSPSKI